MSIGGTVGTFVMPHFTRGDEDARRHLDEAVDSALNQTDPDWQLIIVDDLSPSEQAREYLKKVLERAEDKIHVAYKDTNDGPGFCRNLGIKWAYDHNSPFVLFIDADDVSDPRRVEAVRGIFERDPDADVVYTTFKVIDENSNLVPWEKLSPSIVEILESHQDNPPQGPNAWIEIGTTKGYTNLTSATAVRTDIAYRFPFPPEKVSEDSHTWMRYSAGGKSFVYCPDVPTLYRIPQETAGSSSRSREGGRHGFYRTKARVDTEGFREALELAVENGKIAPDRRDGLLARFYVKLGETMAKENEMDLAAEQVKMALAVSKDDAGSCIREMGLADLEWARG